VSPPPRRLLIAAITVMVPVAAIAYAVLPSSATTLPAAGGVYQLAVTKSGKCIDVPSASAASGALLQQWSCTPGAAWQQFKLTAVGSQYQLINVSSGKCIDVPEARKITGLQLQQANCASSQKSQLWKLTPSGTNTFQIINAATGLCISDKGASTASGAAIIQETCTANSNKRWSFTPVSGTGAAKNTVAADGSGTYRTVQAAIDAVPTDNASRVTITIKPGTYREIVTVPARKPYITLRGTGDSADDVVIVNNRNAGSYGTANSATAFVYGKDFVANNLTFSNDFDENSSDTGDQAVAMHLNADRATFDNVRLLGDQDTLLVNNSARSYFVNSYVEGTVDFIFGGGIAVFHACKIYEKRTSGGPITAASTPAAKTYGFLFYKSTITGAANNVTQLGRPWRADAQVLFRESSLSATVKTAQPWTDMSSHTWQNARFSEYKNTGSGAGGTSNRPQLSDAQAANYTPQKYLAGTDGWNPLHTPAPATPTPTKSGRTWPSAPDGFAATSGGTTGGAGGTTVTVSTMADLQKYVTASEPYIIKVKGAITITPKGTELKVKSNKSIVGVGKSGEIVGGGFFLGAGTRNVIIRNLTIRDTQMTSDDPDDKEFDYDGIQMDTADHIWIDHNLITRMNDGLIDSRKDTSYLTVSWNVLATSNKAFGIGWTDNVTSRMTIHHNWIHDTNQRNPSTDNVALAHLYNNYMQNITSYGNLSRGATRMVLENSYFDKVNNPYYIDTTAAQLKQSGSIVVNSTGRQQANGSAFTPGSYYTYTLDKAADVPGLLKTYAGPQANIGL
jgi:pectin methylesterase-like acyl-CoA thioesterase/pectate lyase